MITSLPFVHTASHSYRLNGSVTCKDGKEVSWYGKGRKIDVEEKKGKFDQQKGHSLGLIRIGTLFVN